MLRVDTHFHPNFSFWLPEYLIRRRARKIWEMFRKRKLDAVFVSEHAFRNPLRSYETLMKYRPRNARTQLVPAVEALTREGIDMIVFSRDSYVFSRRDILTPYRLTIEQLIRRVQKNPRLHGVLPHPSIPSDTGILRHRTARETRKDECILHCAEAYNASLVGLRTLLSVCHLRGIFHRLSGQMERTIRMPARLLPHGIILLGGSDAHHLWDMGSCLLVHTRRPKNPQALFRAILSPRHRHTFFWKGEPRFPLFSVLADGCTALRERMIKKLHFYGVETLRQLPE